MLRNGKYHYLHLDVFTDRPLTGNFTLQPGEEDDATVFSRMFAPGFGVPEDPATGAASGPLGAYLTEYGAVHPDAGAAHIVSRQGVKMGRPSEIDRKSTRLNSSH